MGPGDRMSAQAMTLEDSQGNEHHVEIRPDGTVIVGDRAIEVHEMADGSLRIGTDTGAQAWAAGDGDTRWVFLDGHVYTFTAHAPDAPRSPGRRRRGAAHHGSLAAPMPATVRRVQVAPGDEVRRGDVLIVLEAMKMEMPVRAPADGRVTAVNCREGEMVQAGQDLVDLEEGVRS
jgi:3-methylcrotonyl-CoA carboxylase alpha subunit